MKQHQNLFVPTSVVALLAAAVISFSGCTSLRAQHRGNASQVQTQTAETDFSEEAVEFTPDTGLPDRSEPDVASNAELSQNCTVDHVTFSVDATWSHEPQDGFEGTYITPDRKTAYQLQGVSWLGSFTPEAFYQSLLLYYKESYTIVEADDTVVSFSTVDGVPAYVGQIQMTSRGVMFWVDVLIVPQKNIVVTFAAQCAGENTPPVDIRAVTSTAAIDIGTEDMASGRTFAIENDSEITLAQDGGFIWYQTIDNPESAYCSGTYEVYYGQAAIDKVASMTEYGLTKEELEQTLRSAQNGYKPGSSALDYFAGNDGGSEDSGYHICLDTFYAIVLHNTQLVEAEQTQPLDSSTLYIGYYLPEIEGFDLLNTNTVNHTMWTLS